MKSNRKLVRPVRDESTEATKAMELFGKQARIKQRQARRMTNNETASKVLKVYMTQYKTQMVSAMSKFIDAAYAAIDAFQCYGVKKGNKPSALSVMNELIDKGFCSGYAYIVNLDWIDDFPDLRDEDWETGRIYKSMDKVDDALAIPMKNLKSAIPFIEIEIFSIDDSYGVEVHLNDVDAQEFFLRQFRGFDSFLTPANEAFKDDAADIGRILRDLGLGAGMTCCFAFCRMPIMAALSGAGTLIVVGGDIAMFKNRRSRDLDLKYPTEAEKASLEIFVKKYEPAMIREAEELRRMMLGELGSVGAAHPENGINLQGASPSYLFTNEVYSHFFVAATKAPLDKDKNTTVQKYQWSDRWEAKLNAFNEMLDKKYNGILGTGCLVAGKKSSPEIVFGVTFEWVDSNGVILPNLR